MKGGKLSPNDIELITNFDSKAKHYFDSGFPVIRLS
jgi:hypothetical protein